MSAEDTKPEEANRETTSPRVVAISRTTGAGGEQIGKSVSTALEFRYIDDEIVRRAAQKLDVSPDLVADVEKRKSLLLRMSQELHESRALEIYAFAFTPLPDRMPTSDDYRALVQQVIHETADEGNVVIVSHGASIALGKRADLLRVLITASPEARARRLAADQDLDAAEAAKLVKQDDADRADYLKRFYKINEELPTHYDLTVNTDVLGVEGATGLIVAACGRRPVRG